MIINRKIWPAILLLVLIPSWITPLFAQNNFSRPPAKSSWIKDQKQKQRANKNTLTIITGTITGTYIRIGSDLANVLNRNNLRIITTLGQGSLQNIRDILWLKGIDVGIVQSDALEYMARQKEFRDIKRRIHYITKLFNEEVHILATRDIKSLSDLAGKRVNFGKREDGTYVTASTIFRKLGIKVQADTLNQAIALEKLKRKQISAMVYVVGKPSSFIQSISGQSNLHLIPVPYATALQDVYLPSTLTEKDYPNLITNGSLTPTIATSAVMATYNWPEDSARYKKVAKFINTFFPNINKFSTPPYHPKWQEVSLAAKVPGWTKFKAAKEALAKQVSKAKPGENELHRRFQEFLKSRKAGSSKLTPKQENHLYEAFRTWSQAN